MGQTCCSGGVPLSSNLGLPPSEAKTLQLTMSYDLNVLETLKTGTTVLDDDSRTRKTISYLAGIGYTFNSRFSVDVLFSFVRQERIINQFGQEDFDFTEGIGDLVILAKYTLLSTVDKNTNLTIAAGAKLPTGHSDMRDSRGLTLNADLQPGSGVWDGILWGQFSHNLSFRPSMSFSVTSTYGLRGVNNSYLGSQSYQFGNELQLIGGLSDRIFWGKSLLDLALMFRYRQVGPDKQNGQTVPSTGGEWLFINPGLTYWLNKNMSVNGNVELPLIADTIGTQVSPSYRLNFGLYYSIPFKGNNSLIINNFQQ